MSDRQTLFVHVLLRFFSVAAVVVVVCEQRLKTRIFQLKKLIETRLGIKPMTTLRSPSDVAIKCQKKCEVLVLQCI